MKPLIKVKSDELKVGMHITIPGSWDQHPFLKNGFVLASSGQIEKIIRHGIHYVLVDPGKSTIRVLPSADGPPGDVKTTGESPGADKRSIIPDELHDAMHDSSLPPAEKARRVRQNSLLMMEGLLQNPTADNIRESKKAISEIVEFILRDDEAAAGLMKITDHDYYTYTHSVNVGFWAVSLAKVLYRNSYAHDLHELGAGFFLHDIGKVHIDQAIITKPGRLTEDEMAQMKRHPVLGFHILDEARQLTEESKIIVLQHHERQDGAGYPKGLRGAQIHPYAKICAIADVFDALTSNRPYRQGSSPFDALKIMKTQMLGHFQEDLFGKFVLMLSS
jgi:HD-GYP domain-containing protein (c-di-GMP phosphodiesterase class II)